MRKKPTSAEEFSQRLLQGLDEISKGAMVSSSFPEYLKNPALINRFRKSGFDIMTHRGEMHVLPPLPSEEK